MRVDKVVMKSLLVVCLALAVGCTKPNPNRCCMDDVDCTANSIAVGSECDDGLLCRGHQCIAIPCGASSGCDEAAPYCVAEACAEQCAGDEQCPGFGEAGPFCVTGSCVECRASSDCTFATTPVCATGSCHGCTAHSECPSGACKPDGACADESTVAYVEVSGAPTSQCTKLSPCNTVARAVAVTPARQFILIGGGTHGSAAELTFSGQRTFIGTSATPPTLTRSTTGPIVNIFGGVIARFEHLEFYGATGSGDGIGIKCSNVGGSPSLELEDVSLRENQDGGLLGQDCTVSVSASRFTKNGGYGINVVDGNATIDRCFVSENMGGILLDSGLVTVTNNIVVRNYHPTQNSYGIYVFSSSPGNKIEFNTIADNGDGSSLNIGAGLACDIQSGTASFPSNIIVRNKRQTYGTSCMHPTSIISDTDITAVKFKSPDAAPYDYHLQAGSIAIDAATVSTLNYDFDGDARPNGAGRDVGADELSP